MIPNLILNDNTKVTLELRDIVESGVNIWAFDYPSYYKGDEKTAFEKKVIDHYYFRQIGQETTGRWLHYFRTRIREIMPYYIQLYQSQELMQSIEDPFGNVDITETFEQESEGSTSSEGSNTSTSSGSTERTVGEDKIHKFSNTPQGTITNLETFMTEASVDDNTTTDNELVSGEGSETVRTSGTSGGKTSYTMTKKGNQGVNTYAHDMKELRETFLNIDMQIINELKDLFLMVY